MHNDTIVALATPSGSGAIAVVRLSRTAEKKNVITLKIQIK